MDDSLSDLFIISALALLAPILVDRVPKLGLSIVVVELVIGIVIGDQVLGLVKENEIVALFAQFGLGMLFFLAGFEIQFRQIKGPPLKLGAYGLLMSLIIALTISAGLHAVDYVRSAVLVGVTLCATALGTLTPILRDSGIGVTRLGSFIVGAGVAGEFGVIVLMALLFSGEGSLTAAVLLCAFSGVAVGAGLLASRTHKPRWVELTARSLETSAQIPIRVALVMLLGLMFLTQEFGIDVILGAFAAGIVFRLTVHEAQSRTIESKLDAIGFGFFIPVFFVTSGMSFDLEALTASLGSFMRLPLFFVLLLLVRGVPALILYRGELPSARARQVLALFSATSLPLIIALTQIGIENGTMRADTAAALVAAGVLSVLINPAVALKLWKGVPEADKAPALRGPGGPSSEPQPQEA